MKKNTSREGPNAKIMVFRFLKSKHRGLRYIDKLDQ